MKKIIIASSQFPSGVAWLLNFFLEIKIVVFKNKTKEQMWEVKNEQIHKLKKSEDILKQWIPALSKFSEFTFKPNIIVKWTHDFPLSHDSKDKIILLVRDGRDAIYSLYKRRGGKNILFEEYLKIPCSPLGINPPLTWALFNFLWLYKISPDSLFLIKFEDLKENPDQTVRKILEFLQIKIKPKIVEKAILASSFDKAKEAEEKYKKNHPEIAFTVNRKGAVGEWKNVYTSKELGLFGEFPNLMLQYFGYKTCNNQIAKQLTFDILADYYRSNRNLKRIWVSYHLFYRAEKKILEIYNYLNENNYKILTVPLKILKKILKKTIYGIRQCKNYIISRKNTQRKIKKVLYFQNIYKTKNFIETGTYLGDMIYGVRKYFKKIYSIELSHELFINAQLRFAQEKHITLIEGDSAKKLQEILLKLDQPAIFWLDAHFSGGITARGEIETPIQTELKLILSHQIKKHIILVDDARCFNGKNDYPQLSEVHEFVKKNPNYVFSISEDIIKIEPQKIQ